MHNLIVFLNKGAKTTFSEMELALLNCQPLRDDDGNISGFRAEILPLKDSNKFIKRDGEVVKGPNALHSFNVIVKSKNMPRNLGMIEGIKLVNPHFTSAFATSQLNNTFATIRTTLMCDDIILPNADKRG